MQQFLISRLGGEWVISDPLTASVISTHATTSDMLSGLVDAIIASQLPETAFEIVMQDGDV